MAIAEGLIWRRFKKTVPSLTALDIDTIPTAEFKGLRYHLTAFGGTKSKQMDITVLNEDGTLTDTVFGRVGSVPMSVAAVISGSNTVLWVTNPNGFSIDVDLVRARTGGI